MKNTGAKTIMLDIVVVGGLYFILGYARKKLGWRSFVCE